MNHQTGSLWDRLRIAVAGTLLLAGSAGLASGQVANVKVVTDASPDYSDMESMTRSITGRWENDKEKMWALFYWDHIARRQTNPMILHGMALSDPIRQFNDYGFTMCSTISGVKMSTWEYMGYYGRYFDIGLHTVPEVWYDGGWHHYDNSLSIIYTLCDGKTIAGIADVGKTLACEASGGKAEAGHIALYHALNGTGPNGFVEGADTERDLKHVGQDCFKPSILKYRSYFHDQDRGHRYSLNLRDGETYTRFYSRQDVESPNKVSQSDRGDFAADPAYFVANNNGKDAEAANPRYKIRGNGARTFVPKLTADGLAGALHSQSNIKPMAPSGLQPAKAGEEAQAIFKIEGANVITSLKIAAEIGVAGPEDVAAIAISINNGKDWKELWKAEKPGDAKAELTVLEPINGEYEALVKVALLGKADTAHARLNSIKFDVITQLNAHTQPQLSLGKNQVYVGYGEQSGTITLWPELQGGKYKPLLHEEKNIGNVEKHIGYQGAIFQKQAGEEAYVVFKVDAPQDVTSITYGGRFYNRAQKSKIGMQHSFDGGATWKDTYTLTDTASPWDVIHYERATDMPAGTRSVLFKYTMNGPGKAPNECSIYAVHMEVNHKLAAPIANKPMEVTFTWDEISEDHKKTERSHTAVVDKFPATYTINTGGFDIPQVKSLLVNPQGARGGEVKPGYSDGKDAGGEKFVGKWVTWGKVLSTGKPYTLSTPPVEKGKAWGANDDGGKRLTDGVVGSSYSGGTTFNKGPAWAKGQNVDIVVDLGESQKVGAFRIHILGFPWWDAMKGQIKDKVTVSVSDDGKEFKPVGDFDFNLHWKNIPVNYMYNDEETFSGFNHLLLAREPVQARYVKYAVQPARTLVITEVQALDGVKYDPFDLRIAMPDPVDNGKAPPPPGVSPSAKKFEKPKDWGVPFKRSND